MDKKSYLQVEIGLRIAGLLAGKSIKTMQRWCDEGKLSSRVIDARGKKVISLGAILPYSDLCLQDGVLVARANAGDMEAMCDIGVCFLEARKPKQALHWFQDAVKLGHAGAMFFLADYYIRGDMGVQQNRDTGLKWLAPAR